MFDPTWITENVLSALDTENVFSGPSHETNANVGPSPPKALHPKLSSPHFTENKPRTPLGEAALNKEPAKGVIKTDSPALNIALAAFRKKVQASSKVLRDPQSDWKRRNECFVEIQAALANMPPGGRVSQEDLRDIVFPLVDSMEVQFRELRSKVVKEACKTIEMLAETFFGTFAPLAGVLIPTLVSLTIVDRDLP